MAHQADSLRKILSRPELIRFAGQTGFSRRSSKLSADVFFDLLFYASSLSENCSLEYLCSYLRRQYGIQLKKQSLNEKFTERTVAFVKHVLESLIQEQFGAVLYDKGFLKEFGQVRIKDSTRFNVPANLAKTYRGSAGNATTSPAGISIQFEYDLKTGKILDLTLTPSVRNDQTDAAQTKDQVCAKDLIIRDLGYFSIDVLKSIAGEAYFLSRLSLSVDVYARDGQLLDFDKIYRGMLRKGINLCQKQVLIGKQGFAVRLIIGIVPNRVYQERIRKRKEQARKDGHVMKARTKFLCRFNLFITNADEEQLPAQKVLPLYHCRWQIELCFKNWKSIFSIHKQQKMKEERYITMLYIRLILILVNLQLVNHLQQILTEQGIKDKILSYCKTLKTLKNMSGELLKILRCDKDIAVKIIREIYQTLTDNHWRDKRKNKWNFLDFIGLFI